MIIEHGLAEHLAVLRVRHARFEGGLHETDRPSGRLQAAVLESRHLEVEAAAEAGLAADQVRGGHEPVVEGDLVGVHAAVADRVDRAALHRPAPTVVERERVPLGSGLIDDEHRESAVRLGLVRVGPGEQHQHVGAAGEGGPRLHAAHQPAAVGGRRGNLHVHRAEDVHRAR